MSRFRSLPEQGTTKDFLRLHFVRGADAISLYCHKFALAQWFGVLRGAIEANQGCIGGPHSTGTAAAVASEDDSCCCLTINMPDSGDCEAFEAALEFVYPSVPLPEVTMDSAEKLLLLADKYDSPVLKEMVAVFLRRHLPPALTGDNCFTWLKACSTAGLADMATTCITFFITKFHRLPPGFAATLPPLQTDELCEALQQAHLDALVLASSLQLELDRCQGQLREQQAIASKQTELASQLQHKINTAAEPMKNAFGGLVTCYKCKYMLFKKPNGKDCKFCMNCGASV